MSAAAHRIRRLRWQVRADSTAAGLQWRARLHALLPEVQAALQQALDAQAPDGEVRHLPRLDVQLRLPATTDGEGLMAELGAALTQALQTATWMDGAGHAAGQPVVDRLADPAAVGAASDGGHPPGRAPAAWPSTGRDTTLLCALHSLRALQPQRLQQALRDAWAHRHGEQATLMLLDAPWSVPSALLPHWLAWCDLPQNTAAGAPDAPSAPNGSNVHSAPAPASQAAHRPVATAAPRGDALGAPPPASSLTHAQAQLQHYLAHGELHWAWAGLPLAEARAQLRDTAQAWAALGLWPEALSSTDAPVRRLGVWSRWLALLDIDARARLWSTHQGRLQTGSSDPTTRTPPTDDQAVSASLLSLLQALPLDTPDGLHALALALDWLRLSGPQLGRMAQRDWLQAAGDWVRPWCAQGPASDAWRVWLALGAAWPQAEAPAQGPATQPQPVATATPPARPAAANTALASPAPASLDSPAPPPGQPAEPQAPQASATTQGNVRATQPPTASATPHGVTVAHAGLVLLHPYLKRCFETLGLYPAAQPGQPSQRGPLPDALWPRAAAVLHHLATGSDDALACDLAFARCLLGRSDAPLDHALPTLLPAEREEADAVLQAVLGHWRALKGTSVAGLRQTFLQRPGWLGRTETGWLLRVEPASFDLLLGSLPWGLSLVKLPWMPQPLHVEWTTP